jgi:hypothetical protein
LEISYEDTRKTPIKNLVESAIAKLNGLDLAKDVMIFIQNNILSGTKIRITSVELFDQLFIDNTFKDDNLLNNNYLSVVIQKLQRFFSTINYTRAVKEIYDGNYESKLWLLRNKKEIILKLEGARKPTFKKVDEIAEKEQRNFFNNLCNEIEERYRMLEFQDQTRDSTMGGVTESSTEESVSEGFYILNENL